MDCICYFDDVITFVITLIVLVGILFGFSIWGMIIYVQMVKWVRDTLYPPTPPPPIPRMYESQASNLGRGVHILPEGEGDNDDV